MTKPESYSDYTIRRRSICCIIAVIAGLFGIGCSIYASATHVLSLGRTVMLFIISEFCIRHGLFGLLRLRNLPKN